jgi:hypothetical protein
MIFFIKRDVAKKGERYSPNTDSFVSDLVPLVKEGISLAPLHFDEKRAGRGRRK